jgi:hypothetical protein
MRCLATGGFAGDANGHASREEPAQTSSNGLHIRQPQGCVTFANIMTFLTRAFSTTWAWCTGL